jgi:hypothetical protein
MRTTIFSILIAFSFLNANAQEEPVQNQKEYKHYIGAAAGFTTGYGLAYRYNPGRFNVQVAFSPDKNYDDVTISSGITFIYHLLREERFNFFLYQGNHYHYNHYRYYNSWNDTFYSSTYSELNNGLGIGFEFHYNRFSLNLMTGYGFFDYGRRLSMTVESGIFFRL